MSTNIGAIGSGAAGAAAAAQDKSKLGKDDFLKLLLAQVSNQDPLSPMDNQAFVAQLAQFSNVELLQSANGSLSNILLAQAAANQTAAASLVGKNVTYRSDKVELTAGAPAPVRCDLAAPAASVTAVIKDASGRTVRTLRFGAGEVGTFSATWDGRDDKGVQVPSGSYSVSFTAADASGQSVGAITEGAGHVSGISFANGTAELVVGGVRVQLADVIQIDQAS